MSSDAALYARVSTENQDLDKQVEKLKTWAESHGHNYDLYSEKVSSIKERPEFEKLMEDVEQYDIVAVTKIDRFGRSLQDMLQKMNDIQDQGADFVTVDQPINTEDEMMGDLMTKLLALFADFERKMIRRRLEEGWEEAHKEGRVGRPSKLSEDDIDFLVEHYEDGAQYKYLKSMLKTRRGVDASKSTIYRALKDREVVGGDSE